MATVAVIGGTGAEFFPQDSVADGAPPDTKWGSPSAALLRWQQEGHDILFLARHGVAGVIPPHRVNYRANMDLLASQQVDCIVALNAVGGIAETAVPGQLVIPDQLIDYTWGRSQSIYDGDAATLDFIDFTEPFDASLRQALIQASTDSGQNALAAGTYAVTQGPRLETAAEVDRLERDGCHIVGMTAMPEASLAREYGLRYASCCIVVNAAPGRGSGPIHGEIANYVEAGMQSAAKLFAALLRAI